MKQLYFVRHGESELNARHVFAGQTDTPLSGLGREQAQAAGIHAKLLHFDVIVSSPLKRALETAQLIAKEIAYPLDNIRENDIFKERSLGALEGQSWDEVDENHATAAGIETWETLLVRAQSGLAYLQAIEDDIVLLVGHGSFVRALQTAIDPLGSYPEPPNARIVQLI